MRLTDESARRELAPSAARRLGSVPQIAVAALAGASVLGLAMSPAFTNDAAAQLKPDSRTIQTPFGRAPLSFADIVERVKPAVVSIHVTNGKRRLVRRSERRQPGGGGNGPFGDLPKDHPFNEFFKRFGRIPGGQPIPRQSLAQGSGFVVSADGYIVTNNHVIKDASLVHVSFDDGKKIAAKVIGKDPRTDLALLKISGKSPYPYLNFAKKRPRVGEWVLAVGNPFGLGGTVTAGIVSAHERSLPHGVYRFMQIDAAVNKGNSGGPTFNLEGEVVGVNTAIYSPGSNGGNVGIAFAVPASVASEVIRQLKETGTVKRGWLGIAMQPMSKDIALSQGLSEVEGVLVRSVTAGSPAEAAGLKAGDAIMAVNGRKVKDTGDLARRIGALPPASIANLDILRRGRPQQVAVKLGTFPTSNQLARLQKRDPPQIRSTVTDELGMVLVAASKRSGSNAPGVVITKVAPGSDAAEKGLKPGDVILQVGGDDVNKPGDVADGVKQAKKLGRKAVLLRVKSGNRYRFVGLQIVPKQQ